jgi:hypothetical protein
MVLIGLFRQLDLNLDIFAKKYKNKTRDEQRPQKAPFRAYKCGPFRLTQLWIAYDFTRHLQVQL